ncbi:unnamed protein product [Effrenium voratum]|nr:unnamed protein product [Effrenium voratum]
MGCARSCAVEAPSACLDAASPASRPASCPAEASPRCSPEPAASPLLQTLRRASSERSRSPFRLVLSASERSLPGDSAFLWSPVLIPKLRAQGSVRAGDMYDSDSEAETSGTRRKPASFLKWSKSSRPAKPERWAHPAKPMPETTPEPPEVTAPQESPDEQRRLQKLAFRAREVRQLLRPQMRSEEELAKVVAQVSRCSHFLAESLPHAAETVGVRPSGLVFQALLRRAGLGRAKPAVELEPALGGRVEKLALAAGELCQLLRVKVEDDGDLSLALKVLEDSKRFFRALSMMAEGRGTSSFRLLEELAAL